MWRRSANGFQSSVDFPSIKISPALSSNIRLISFRAVDFPAPLRPSRTSVSPLFTERFKSRSKARPSGSWYEALRSAIARDAVYLAGEELLEGLVIRASDACGSKANNGASGVSNVETRDFYFSRYLRMFWNTFKSIASVSLPVKVFCWLG